MNESIINKLLDNYKNNTFSHAYLIETNNINDCFIKVKELIKKIYTFLRCDNVEKLIDNDNFPGLIVIKSENQEIKKEQIIDLKNRFDVTNVFAEASFYIIVEPEKLNSFSFNSLLKFLEEPENNIYGFLITSHKDFVAPTIISRCLPLKMCFESNDLNDDLVEDISMVFIKSLTSNKKIGNSNDIINSLDTKDKVVSFLKILYTEYEKLFSTSHEMLYFNCLYIVNKYLNQIQYNVNLNLMFHSFVIEMENVYEK